MVSPVESTATSGLAAARAASGETTRQAPEAIRRVERCFLGSWEKNRKVNEGLGLRSGLGVLSVRLRGLGFAEFPEHRCHHGQPLLHDV